MLLTAKASADKLIPDDKTDHVCCLLLLLVRFSEKTSHFNQLLSPVSVIVSFFWPGSYSKGKGKRVFV